MSECENNATREVGSSQKPRIVLKRDWDVPVNLPLPDEEKRGHFAGRLNELHSLTNEISRRSNGAILVAGHRGVGKTSLVHKAILEAQRSNPKILAVLLNAAQLDLPSQVSVEDAGRDKAIDPKAFIEYLIRRLFATIRARNLLPATKTDDGMEIPPKVGEPAYRQVEVLYRKAVAQEFKLTQSLSAQARVSEEQTQRRSM